MAERGNGDPCRLKQLKRRRQSLQRCIRRRVIKTVEVMWGGGGRGRRGEHERIYIWTSENAGRPKGPVERVVLCMKSNGYSRTKGR